MTNDEIRMTNQVSSFVIFYQHPRSVRPRSMLLIRSSLFVALLLLAGCTNAVQSGHSTALDSFDLEETSQQMTASILASPQVHEAIEQEGPLRVVVERVENRMTGEILPRPEAEAFTARI